MQRETACQWLVENYAQDVSELVAYTRLTNKEHGFTLVGHPEDVSRTNIITGSESSININQGVSNAFTPVQVSVHTHPSGFGSPSYNDWRGFLADNAQYHPKATWPDGWRQALAIVTFDPPKPPDYKGAVRINALELTTAGIGLSIDEQTGGVQPFLRALPEDLPMTFPAQQFIEDQDAPINVCFTRAPFNFSGE